MTVAGTDRAAGGADLAARVARVREGAHSIRRHVLDMGAMQGQGYVGQALGVADVLAALYLDQLRLRAGEPQWPERDRLLLSIGHYAIAVYAALAVAGVLDESELHTYGSDSSRLPMSAMASYTPGMEISGGSLGHGLGIAVGMALGLRHQGNTARVYNILSDGELNEGSTWEAAMAAARHGLGGLTAVVDMNALQADGPTADVLAIEPVEAKWRAFGWQTTRLDGNDVPALLAAFDDVTQHAAAHGPPSVVICDTRIGRGVPLLETRERAHFMQIAREEWAICREQLEQGRAR